MLGKRSKRAPLQGSPAIACAFLDALALQLDLGAAVGRHPLLKTPVAVMARFLSASIAFWTTSWASRVLGLSFLIHTFQRGKQPPR